MANSQEKVRAEFQHSLYGRIMISGFRSNGKATVMEAYKPGPYINLLSFEFNDRNFPCGGFSRADVAEMEKALLSGWVISQNLATPKEETETTIWDEFRALTDNEWAISELESAEKCSFRERKRVYCTTFLKAIFPEKPGGKTFHKDNFWARIAPWAIMAMMSDNHEYQAKKAKWLRWQRLSRGCAFPKPFFVPMTRVMPQPNPRIDFDNGRVPNDGKK